MKLVCIDFLFRDEICLLSVFAHIFRINMTYITSQKFKAYISQALSFLKTWSFARPIHIMDTCINRSKCDYNTKWKLTTKQGWHNRIRIPQKSSKYGAKGDWSRSVGYSVRSVTETFLRINWMDTGTNPQSIALECLLSVSQLNPYKSNNNWLTRKTRRIRPNNTHLEWTLWKSRIHAYPLMLENYIVSVWLTVEAK